MGSKEKHSLINSLTISLVEEFGIDIKKTQSIITEALKCYRVNIEDVHEGEELTTEYLMRKYREGKHAIGMTDKTIQQYQIAVNSLEKYTGKTLAEAEPEDINAFFIEYRKKVSSVTIRQKYALLSSVYQWLYTRKYIGFNPMLNIEPPKATVVYKKQLSELELEKLKKACEELPDKKESLRDMALLHFFVSTGCRVSEVKNIKLGAVDFDKKCCKVLGKGNKERYVVLTDKTIYRLKLYLAERKCLHPDSALFTSVRGEERPLTTRGMELIVERLKETTGITELTCHTFRRYYATELRKRDVSIQVIAKSLGHANLNQINRYSLFTNDEMLDEIRHSM